jgi:hypothetical protein
MVTIYLATVRKRSAPTAMEAFRTYTEAVLWAAQEADGAWKLRGGFSPVIVVTPIRLHDDEGGGS